MTHAAIDACLTKFSELMARYRQIPNLPTSWLDNLKVEHVVKGADHLGPSRTYDYVYAGTVFQVGAMEFKYDVLPNQRHHGIALQLRQAPFIRGRLRCH